MPAPDRRQWVALVVAVAPWTWYLVRNVDPRIDAVALAWPVVGFGGAVALALVSIVVRGWEEGAASMSWLAATVAVVILPWVPLGGGTPADGLRVVAANSYGTNTDADGITADVKRQDADVLVVSEISEELDAVLTRQFPHRQRHDDTAVFSTKRLRYISPMPAEQRGLRVEVDGRFILYAVHLDKPGVHPSNWEVGFRTHRRVVEALADGVASEEKPVILAGDLNLIDRSSGYRRLTAELDDAMRAGWVGPTSRRGTTKPLLARIDHILMPESWCSTRTKMFELHGSDHRGIAATIGRCR